MKVLITGARGFIGKNLAVSLALRADTQVLSFDVDNTREELCALLAQADAVIHLAGVNRPQDPAEFEAGNADLTRALVAALLSARRAVPVVLSSSSQAALDNPYGRSKRAAEEAVLTYGRASGAPVYVYRFPNVFGKWCRPHYNSVVATFCHQAARGLPLRVDDPAHMLTLLYIDDLLDEMARALAGQVTPGEDGLCRVPCTHTLTLGELADRIEGFAAARQDFTLRAPMDDALTRKLYATFLSCLPEEGFAVPAVQHSDARGYFAELIRSPAFGQVSVSRTRPGVTRGQHWHHTKAEKFIVVQGRAVIRFRRLGTDEVLAYKVSGDRVDVVDIPPGYTHAIENVGQDDLVLIIWASELFDPARPDTYYEEVDHA